MRAQQGIHDTSFVILYCGRLSKEKSLFDLLEAYHLVNCKEKSLIIVGDGELRKPLEEHVVKHSLDSVHFFGFRNRNEIAQYYATADVLILPSKRETWGIVVNEALCFGLPVIVSDQVGAARDLVRNGHNGFSFPSGDVKTLAARIQQLIELPREERLIWGMKSQDLIRRWLDRNLVQSIDQYFDFIYSRRQPTRSGRPE